MKTRMVIITMLVSAGLLVPALSSAETTISIGGTAWYVWWNPAWSENRFQGYYLYSDTAGYWQENARDFKPGSSAMAGPIVTIGFLDRWSISSVAVIGSMDLKARGIGFGTDIINELGGATHKDYRRKVLKWDSDTTLGCAVHRNIKIYAGFKAQGYRYRETTHYYDFTMLPAIFIDHSEATEKVSCYGPGLGIGATVPLVENLFMLINLSGVVLWCREKANPSMSHTYGFDSSGFVLSYFYMPAGKFISYGGTATLSLAYVIDRINTTLALGGRYQVLYNRQKKGNMLHSDVTLNIIDKQFDHFYGITMSAIYTFHIGKKA